MTSSLKETDRSKLLREETEEYSKKEDLRHEQLKRGFEVYCREMDEINSRLEASRASKEKQELERRLQYAKEQEERLLILREYADALKEIQIDEIRHKHENIELLKKLESKTVECPKICSKCAYRNYENSMCWYLMIHDKPANKDNKEKCNHFVDAIKFIEERKKLKWQNR